MVTLNKQKVSGVDIEKITSATSMPESSAKEGSLRVWHNPQLGRGAIFYVYGIRDVKHALEVIETLSAYDLFQLENSIKPDFCNCSGLEVFEGGGWEEYANNDHEDISDIHRKISELIRK